MSRGKTRRRRARTAAGYRRPVTASASATTTESVGNGSAGPAANENRVESARRRARFAKAVFCAGGAVVFAGAMMLSRASFPGHAKEPAQPLSAPKKFVKIVRRNLLQAGIVAPAQAPPGASTSVS